LGIDTVLDDVGATRDQNWILKQIVGGSVLLKNNDDVPDVFMLCASQRGGTTFAVAVQVKDKSGGDE
jgi:hypothetical protein